MLFLLFEAAELYKECNKSDVTEQSASWDTCGLDQSDCEFHCSYYIY